MTIANDMNPLMAATPDAVLPRAVQPVDQLNSFLRGEISATETYRMAIEKASGSSPSDHPSLGLLRETQAQHGRAAQALRERIRDLGGEPEDSSGAWGVWAKLTTGLANLLGDTATLRALKEGEQHGLAEYRDGIDAVDTASAELLRNQLIPAQEQHVTLLDQLLSSSAK